MSLHNNKVLMSVCLMTLTLLACSDGTDSDTLMHRYAEVDAEAWGQHDTVWIDLPTCDSTERRNVNVDLEVRVLQSYPYQNLTLRTFLKQNGKLISSERSDFRLFEEDEPNKSQKTDESNNRKQSPTFVEASRRLHPLVLRPHTQSSIGIVHIMRIGELQGVTHVGIKLTENNNHPQNNYNEK